MIIKPENVLPVVLIIIDVFQAIVCFYTGNKPKSLYWFSAAVLTYSTILMQ